MTQAGAGENPICPAHVRMVAERLEAYVEGYVIDQWRNPESHQDRAVRLAAPCGLSR
jgi:hypothetical protein